jgi:uncharacterized protein YndB with AHSA1/START domain
MRKGIGIALLVSLIAVLLFWPSNIMHAQGGHSIVLTWAAPTTGGAPTSYIINKGTTAGGEVAGYATVAAPTLTYTDTVGTGGVTYYYTVSASNSGGTSLPSNEASAVFLAQAPGVPGSAVATSH